MRVAALVGTLCLTVFAVVGCAEEGEGGLSPGAAIEREDFARETERETEELEGERREEGRESYEPQPEPEVLEEEVPEESEELEEGECHPSYTGACLDPTAVDYDCEGGEGNGPLYTGPVTVVGPDDYDLDRDGDGSACEWS